MTSIRSYFFLFVISTGVINCTSMSTKRTTEKYLSYVFSPNSNEKSIDVEFEMKGSLLGETLIKHTKEWAGSKFKEDITNFKVVSG